MGLVSQFATSAMLASQVTLHITRVVAGMLVDSTSTQSEKSTASKPDIRPCCQDILKRLFCERF